MSPGENKVRIRKFSGSDSNYYCIEVRKWFLFVPYWEKIDNFIGWYMGVWNPVLMEYKEAKEFATKAKNKSFLDNFRKEQRIAAANWHIEKRERYKRECPVEIEEV